MSGGLYEPDFIPCINSSYQIVVRAYALGQHRIQLCKGNAYIIVREACTYKFNTASHVAGQIIAANDPEAYMESLAKPWNCEAKGGRIRLDNEPPKL